MTAFPDEESPAASAVPPPEDVLDLHLHEPDTGSWRDDLTGLLRLGYLTAWFDWCGHRIELKTLTTDEELLVASLVRDHEGGLGGAKSYATAMAGMCVTAIDGQPMPVPLGEHPGQERKWAYERYNYARRWFPPTIDAIFTAYLALEVRQREVIEALGKAPAPAGTAIPG